MKKESLLCPSVGRIAQISVLCMLFPAFSAFASEPAGVTSGELAVAVTQQNKQVTGTVVDETGEPIIGANVVVKGTTNGNITDFDGKFVLEDVPENATLQISYIGYTTQEIPVAGKTSVNVTLKEDTEQLEEVVVVGYGTQKKGEITSSVTPDFVTQKVCVL